jgi:hypothetical protein
MLQQPCESISFSVYDPKLPQLCFKCAHDGMAMVFILSVQSGLGM